jgi:uncharacterized RDD family membrane protein YckC
MDLRRRTAFADVPNRVVAYAVDAVILTVAALVAAIVVSVVLGPTVSFDPAAERLTGAVTLHRGLGVVNALVSTVLSGLYFVLSWTRFRATPGQRLLRLQVWGADGERVPLRGAVLRWLLLAAPVGVLSAIVVGSGVSTAVVWLLVLAWDLVLLVSTARSHDAQGLHDQVAGTTVVKLQPRRDRVAAPVLRERMAD